MTVFDLLKKENNNLDLIRIILACMVIYGHTIAVNGPSSFWIDPIAYLFKYTYSGSLAVKIFFFISGLVVTNSLITNTSIKYFVISRFFRLMPALFFVLFVAGFIVGPIVTKLTIKEYFSNTGLYHYIYNNLIFQTVDQLPMVFKTNHYPNAVNGSLWSLFFEVACYIALLGVFLLFKNKIIFLNLIVTLIIFDGFLSNKIIFVEIGSNPEINLLPAAFAFGAFFAINAKKLTVDWHLIIGFYLIYFVFRNTNYAQLLLIFAFCVIILHVSSNHWFVKLRPKHDISYGVYLWGFLVQQTIFYFIGHIYAGFHFLLSLILSIILATISNILIEKPFIKLGKKLTRSLIK